MLLIFNIIIIKSKSSCLFILVRLYVSQIDGDFLKESWGL